jgi:glucan-binding YG repeat protein
MPEICDKKEVRQMKRILAAFLCLVLLCAVLPMPAAAATDAEVQRICDQIEAIYKKTQRSAGYWNLEGFCGLMAGWELYHLGITEVAITQNGNDMYDTLKSSPYIREGYRVDCYPDTEYSLEEALNTVTACGTRDVYNIMVGFHWTHTAAGRLWGHVMVIHAILDGIVYFTEGFATDFGKDPSKAMICTIEEFAELYDSWTRFEGLIHFGDSSHETGDDIYGSNLFVQTENPVTLQTAPEENCKQFGRTVQAGERLYATATVEKQDGSRYYRIEEAGQTYYVPTQDLTPVYFAYDDLKVTDLVIPAQIAVGEKASLTGQIRSQNMIATLVLQVADSNGEVVNAAELRKNSYMVTLDSKAVTSAVNLSSLPAGNYTYSIFCDMVNYHDTGELVIGDMQRVQVAQCPFTVGEGEPVAPQEAVVTVKQIKNGWNYDNGLWYYYENDLPKTGWYCENGVDYYLLPDGQAATGWHNIHGKNRYFTETGALRSGWLETAEGKYYLRSNGEPAVGCIYIDGTAYFFEKDGRMVSEYVVEVAGVYYMVDHHGNITALN